MSVVLDLFCGEGGASTGYHNAYFCPIGIDNSARALSRYPFKFYQTDWRDGLKAHSANADVIAASPPCQAYSGAVVDRTGRPDLVAPVREALQSTGKHWVIENVKGAPLINPVELCGCMFDLTIAYRGVRFALYRPRLFEATFPIPQPEHKPHRLPALPIVGHGVPGWFMRKHGFGIPADVRKQLMGTTWMTRAGLAESIPPVYTEFIGHAFRAANGEQVAA